VSCQGGEAGSVELFDELLADAKIITTGGTGEHGETQAKAETITLRSGPT
jgi:methylglyoxal synthase